MPDIKTRDVVKGTVKTLNRSAVAVAHMKEAYIRTKDKAEHGVYSAESGPEEYAAKHITDTTEVLAHEAVHQFDKQGRKAVRTTGDNIKKAKQYVAQKKADLPRQKARKDAEAAAHRKAADTVHSSARSAQTQTQAIKTVEHGNKSIKTIDRSEKAVKQTAKSTGTAVKSTQKSVKTAAQTGKATIKTAETTAKAAQKSAQAAAKTAHRAAQTAKATAKATVTAVKAAAKATAAAVKAIIAGTKALISAIVAGGWIAVVVVVIICLVGLLVGSCFGIFFSGEDAGTGQNMPSTIREINTDYETQLDSIRNTISYDDLEMSGSRAVWSDVLSIYAVKTTTDPDNPQEVASMDDEKKAILKDIFWQMNEISSRTETSEEIVITETDDGNGNIVETTTTETRTTLYITVSHKTADEMAEHFNFTEAQRAQLAELLADKNKSLWASVLYGIGIADDQIVAVALSQVGNVGGEPYWSWYGFGGRVEWCACFVSWCANECGYIDAGVIPKFAGCVNGVQWFRDRGQWMDNAAVPEPGMIIFFDWDNPGGSSGPQDGQSDHVGIVEKVEDGRVWTIEGNSGDSCRQRSYPLGYYEILGYGAPAY